MAKFRYSDKKLGAPKLRTIETANVIVDEYAAQGFDLTLRQLYYQMVARDHIENSEHSYKNFGNAIRDGRLAGLIDWERIVDRTRNLRKNGHWRNPADIIERAADSYATDKWATQPNRIEVWVEKEAATGVIETVCGRLDVPFFACKGYNSLSEAWAAGTRLKGYCDRGQTPVILYMGDHDPSGMDMTRNVAASLERFAGEHITVTRIALNFDQIQQYNPPPQPAKVGDKRAAGYIAKYGGSSWELDALNPSIVARLIETHVGKYLDSKAWATAIAIEDEGRELLQLAARHWGTVAEHLQN